MLNWFQALMPKEERFFDLFTSHAETVVAGAEALRRLLRGENQIAHCCKLIVEHEAKADDITREMLMAVRRSFITPFDRSDIQELITSMDDAIDQMHQTAKVITLFEVDRFRTVHARSRRRSIRSATAAMMRRRPWASSRCCCTRRGISAANSTCRSGW
jgi:uncharacterized protein Yka (UPF0111/DUF47 family)